MSFNSFPTFAQSLTEGGRTSKVWYFFLQGLWNGIPPGAENFVAAGLSPFIYTAPRGGFLIVQGGTVSFISFSRNQSTFYNTGETTGVFPLSKGDSLSISYSAAPNLTFVPQ